MALVNETFRNPLFRKRVIEIEFRDGVSDQPLKFQLTEVDTIKITTNGSVPILTGAIRGVIQPWYFKPYTIEITGKSYIGAFDRIASAFPTINVATDTNIEQLIDLRDRTNAAFTNPQAVNSKFKTILRYIDPKDMGNKSVSHEFDGFFADVSINETESSPYIKAYSLAFVGEMRSKVTTSQAKTAAKSDAQNTKKSATPPVTQTAPDPNRPVKAGPSFWRGADGSFVNSPAAVVTTLGAFAGVGALGLIGSRRR